MTHRTTLTLQDDVYEAVRERAARTGRRVRDVVNDALRRGLAADDVGAPVTLGTFSAHLRVDVTSTSRTLEELEGPGAR